MSFLTWLGFRTGTWHAHKTKTARKCRRSSYKLNVEPLEDRTTPSGGEQLFLGSYDGDSVLRYDGLTGGFIDTFVPKHSGGLNQPYGILFGPHDGDLYVSTGEWGGPGQTKAVLRFDGQTGAFVENFAKGGDLESPRSIIFGPDGNLYVADRRSGGPGGRIVRYDGQTGAYLGDFVPWLSGGLKIPTYLVFGPSERGSGQLDLYVTNLFDQNVLRYHGSTGAFLGVYVASRSGGLESPMGLTFGEDGNLYLADASYQTRDPKVLRFEGPNGTTPGAWIDAFVPAYSSGKRLPFSLLFGPDGNDDGHLDLYVNDADVNTGALNGKNGSVKRFDGITGALIDTFVLEGDHGLQHVGNFSFTSTDPVTLAYRGAVTTATARSAPAASATTGMTTIDVGDVIKFEGNQDQTATFLFTDMLSAAYDHPVTMSFRTANGTAKTGDGDYVAKSGTLTFAPGETTKTITIEVKGDSKREGNETFYLDLFDLSGNALFTKNRGIGTILNDD